MLIMLKSGNCPDSPKQQFQDANSMKAAGWNIHAKSCSKSEVAAESPPYPSGGYGVCVTFASICKEVTYYAFIYDRGSSNRGDGKLSTTFQGSGRATLDFGNCYYNGEVVVHLNNVQIGSALPLQKSIVVEFDYKPGDTLAIQEINYGIIAINSLKLCGGMGK